MAVRSGFVLVSAMGTRSYPNPTQLAVFCINESTGLVVSKTIIRTGISPGTNNQTGFFRRSTVANQLILDYGSGVSEIGLMSVTLDVDGSGNITVGTPASNTAGNVAINTVYQDDWKWWRGFPGVDTNGVMWPVQGAFKPYPPGFPSKNIYQDITWTTVSNPLDSQWVGQYNASGPGDRAHFPKNDEWDGSPIVFSFDPENSTNPITGAWLEAGKKLSTNPEAWAYSGMRALNLPAALSSITDYSLQSTEVMFSPSYTMAAVSTLISYSGSDYCTLKFHVYHK
jgi:hypothetical protein